MTRVIRANLSGSSLRRSGLVLALGLGFCALSSCSDSEPRGDSLLESLEVSWSRAPGEDGAEVGEPDRSDGQREGSVTREARGGSWPVFGGIGPSARVTGLDEPPPLISRGAGSGYLEPEATPIPAPAPGCTAGDCHEAVVADEHPHAPVAGGVCSMCHVALGEPEAHEFQLRGAEDVICKPCHAARPSKDSVHEPFSENQCLGCHDPHGSVGPSLLRSETEAETCRRCHEREHGDVLHDPYAVDQCNVCHQAHESDHAGLLILGQQELCQTCHVELHTELDQAAFIHGPVVTDCAACHTPHSSTHAGLLHQGSRELCLSCHEELDSSLQSDRVVHGVVHEEHGCSECHTPHGSQLESLVRRVPAELCLECHDREIVDPETGDVVRDVASVLRSSKFKHGPIQNGDCQGCHNPHSSPHANLLHHAFPKAFYQSYDDSHYDLCFQCHERKLALEPRTTTLTGFRDGDLNLHHLHVNKEKGRSCRACHEVHASNRPFHIRESVPYGRNNWELPINFEKTQTGGTCTPGCHRTESYDNVSTSRPDRARAAGNPR